jgi:dTDP-glucose pyrophosphorylase
VRRPDFAAVFIPPDATVRRAVEAIDASGHYVALVVDADERLLATVTDGDVRRGMLAGVSLDEFVSRLLDQQRALGEQRPMPLTARLGSSNAELTALMQRYDVRQIPLLDDAGRVRDIVRLEELVDADGPPLEAVVMAGGLGTRLRPLTDDTPKPMLPVGNQPLLERIVAQLRDAGIRHVNVTTHYGADAIASHFGDGEAFGVQIEYVPEEQPLGTAGALGLIDGDLPLLVMNGDILTTVDFTAMHRFHHEQGADMTVAVRQYEVHVPYGLVELDDLEVTALAEKPLVSGFVNAGIYLIGPDARRLLTPGERLEMPELIERVLAARKRVVGFPLREYWLDIGRIEDYEQALVDVEGL